MNHTSPSAGPEEGFPASGASAGDPDPHADFVRRNTRLRPPADLGGLLLHQADEAHELWHRTERELARAGLDPPFWAFAWAGGLGLARYVLDHPERVAGRRVLDFATGSGLVALAAARAGAACVSACDIDPLALCAAALNADANGVSIALEARDLVGSRPPVDLVLAGDVFYDRAMATRLVPWFDALAAEGIEVLVGDPGRPYLPAARARRVASLTVPTTLALEDASEKRVAVWRWRAEA